MCLAILVSERGVWEFPTTFSLFFFGYFSGSVIGKKIEDKRMGFIPLSSKTKQNTNGTNTSNTRIALLLE